MSYFSQLGLQKEPFSSSPDPDFFYPSLEYKECLQRLELSIRLKRGLNLILGDVGLGKTSFSRLFLKRFKQDEDHFMFRLLLDPGLRTEFQFITALINLFGIDSQPHSSLEGKNVLEDFLYKMGVQEQKTLVLIVDEGQKLNQASIEILRTLLNFETDQYKLLQLIIFAQMEFIPLISNKNNFCDRVNLRYIFAPLSEEDTRKLIDFRLEQAGLDNNSKLFTNEAYRAIYRHTQGFPRKIINLCHHTLISLLIKQKSIADEEIINYALPSCETNWS